MTTCYHQFHSTDIVARSQPCVCLIWRRRSTPLTMIFWCFAFSVSLVVFAGPSELFLAATDHSFAVHLLCSVVPQGSVLGPHMFTMYTADLAHFVGERQVNFHSFADDSQTYMHCSLGDVGSVVCQLEGCITEVGHWMSANRLKLNTDKTELVWTGSIGITWVYLEAAVSLSSLVTIW